MTYDYERVAKQFPDIVMRWYATPGVAMEGEWKNRSAKEIAAILREGFPEEQSQAWRNALYDAKARIALDKSTFASFGRDTKGHLRALMLIDETIEDWIKSAPPAPDVAALRDIITRLIGCLVPFIGQQPDDAGKPPLTHWQELGHKTIGEAAALLRSEPKEEKQTLREALDKEAT
jgi:hypothetical protein